jgi:RHS repeat-associated protein
MSDTFARPYSLRQFISSILLFLFVLLGSPAYGQATFTGVTVTPSSGTAGGNGTLNVTVSGTTKWFLGTTGDSVYMVELYEGTTVLATQYFDLTFNSKDIVYNTPRTISMQAALGVGTHSLHLKASLVGESSTDTDFYTVVVGTEMNGAGYTSYSAPSQVTPGQSFNVSVTMSNSGSKIWGSSGSQAHWLGTQNPENNMIWGVNRIPLPSSTIVPGGSSLFSFTLTAPATAGSYSIQLRMLQEFVEWFGPTVTIPITVVAGDPTPTFSSPAAGAAYTATGSTATVTFSGNATAGAGASLSALALLENGVSFGSGSASPISASTALSVGQHTIELRATNSAGKTASAYRTVTVSGANPTISVSPLSMALTAGQEGTVTWSTSNGTSVSRVCTAEGIGYSGTVALTTAGSRTEIGNSAWVGYPSTCTWTVSGTGGSASATQTMTTSGGGGAPTIAVTPLSMALTPGQESTVTWNTTNATSVSRTCTSSGSGYSGAIALATNGSRTETGNTGWVGAPSTCTWTASGAGGNASVTQTMTTSIAGAPTISVSPLSMALTAAQDSTVTWSTTNATSVSRVCTASGSGYIGTVALATAGSRSETGSSAWVSYPSTCTWTATGAGGSASVTQTMTTASGGGAPTISVSPLSMVLAVGAPSTVTWSTTNATSVSRVCTAAGAGYSGTVALGTDGSRTETASSAWVDYPSTCTWTVSGPGGNASVTQTMTTTYGGGQPTISVSPLWLGLIAGQPTTVSWSTTNATSVLRVCTASGTGYSGTEARATAGAGFETGQTPWIGSPSTCVWTASGAGGSASVTQTMTTGAGSSRSPALMLELDLPQRNNDDGGSLPGKLTATTGGAVAYGIPLMVPPGTAGMVPSLSLAYDSAKATGSAGLGWNLAGVSSIERCGRTLATDNVADAVRFDGYQGGDSRYDRLCIDGQRLTLVNGDSSDAAYWTPNAEYRTEVESFTRVRTVMIGSQRSFKVETRDGRVAYFGDTADSYIDAVGRSDGQAYRWRMSRMTDRSNNYISYLYSEDGITGENKPVEIRWGGNTANGQPHYSAVRLTYEVRPDPRKAYIAGSANFEATRLKEVASYVEISADGSGGVLAQRYTLAYETSATSGRSLLKSVQACDNTICLPATIFDYGTRSSTTPGFTSLGGPRTGPNLFALGNNGAGSGYAVTPIDEIVVGDFNGDGKADILERYRVGANANQQRLYQSNADGMGWTEKTPFSGLSGNLAVMETGDFDGDGRVDILVANWTLGSPASNWRICWGRDRSDGVFPCNGSVTFPANSWSNILPPLPKRIVRDLNGDGKDDLLLRGGTGAANDIFRYHKCMSNGSAFSCTDVTGTYIETAFGVADEVRPSAGTTQDDVDGDGIPDRVDLGRCVRGFGDADGDGQTDWTCDEVYGGGANSYIRVSNFPAIGVPGVYGEWDQSPNNKTAALPPTGSLTGDFNGDGYSDLVYGSVTLEAAQGALNARSRICLSKGNGEADCSALPGSSTPGQDHLVMMVGDFDGDGMPDVLRPANDSYTENNVTGYKLCHIGYSAESHSCEAWAGPVFYGVSGSRILGGSRSTPFLDSDYARNRSMFLGDFDGDGRPDVATYTQGSSWEIFVSADLAKAGEALEKLVRVTNGNGHVERAEYAKANSVVAYSNSVVPYGSAAVQQGKLTQPGQLVRAMHRSNGRGGWLDTEYAYRGHAYDPLRRESLGFAQVEERDVQNSITTTTWFHQSFPYVGMAQYVRSVDRDGTVLLASESTAATRSIAQANGNSTRLPYVSALQVRRKDLDGSFLERISATSTVDDWGNLIPGPRDSYASDIASTPVGTVAITRTYDNDGASWRLGEVRTNVETRTFGGSSQSRNTSYTYDNAGMLATETVEADDVTLRVKKTYDRSSNIFGLVNRVNLEWSDPQGATRTRTVSDVAFTANGRFTATRKNALNHLETLQFDARNGAMTQLTDANGLVSSASHDGFGRQSRATAIDGTETRTYYKLCNVSCPSHAASATIRTTKRGADTVAQPNLVFSDSSGHPVRSLSWGFNSLRVSIDTEYDAQGRIWRKMQPVWVTDADGLAGTVPASAKLDSAYGYDDLGRITSVQTKDEANATLTSVTAYTGLTTTATNAKNQQNVETKDEWGRLKTARDAKSKLTTYTYDAFSNLKTTTDTLGNVITVSYDKLGRKIALDDRDLGIIQYEVDALGQVWRQTTPNQRAKGAVGIYSTRMTYDELGRMTARVAQDHTAGWVYDKLDTQMDCNSTHSCGKLVESFTLAGVNKDFRRQHTYDSLGRPDLVTTYQPDATYTSRTEYDDWGRVIAERHRRGTGDERVFERRYNNYGFLSRIERGALVLWLATNGDAAGRITSANLGNGTSLTRTYNANTGRLSSGVVSNQSGAALQEGYSYDALGNVLTRTQYWGATGFGETFSYDVLNRLETATITGQPQQIFAYNDIGNLVSKTGVGTYTYPLSGATSVRPHAVTGIPTGSLTYDLNGNLLSAPGRLTLWEWTSFDMPRRLTKGSNFSEFVYGADRQRLRQTRADMTIYYAGAMEAEVQSGATAVKTYWPMGLGVEIERNSTTTMNWTHLDRLGSVVAITNQSGTVVEKLAYDSWGNRRALTTAATPTTLDGVVDNKGYTGHETLDKTDLVHMNGRIYDPLLARFMSADPLIQEPTNGQSYNRYSYVWNNPTNLTDPSGFAALETNAEATTSGADQTVILLPTQVISALRPFCGVRCVRVEVDSFMAFTKQYVLPGVKTVATRVARPVLVYGSRAVGVAAGGAIAAGCDFLTAGGCAPANPLIVGGTFLAVTAGGLYLAEKLEEALDASSGGTNSEGSSVPPVPDKIVGDQSSDLAGQRGKKHTTGALTPENGGVGDYEKDLEKLTGGTRPWREGDKYPPGSQIGANGIFGRPENSTGGKSIDIPANGKKPHETLHYP